MADHVDHIGQQIGHYRLTRLLGQGGFADVYLGEHVYLKTQAALKMLQTRLVNNDMETFLKEARTIANLTHPHIVRVIDFGVENGTPFLVMDYAPNGTLRDHHPKGSRLPLKMIAQYVQEVAGALQYAHDHRLIHRDVKPENMLVGQDIHVLLSDFGIALATQSSRYQSTQEVVGTAAYMAPEQLQGKPQPASDQYSLAIIVYEWLCGERPFQGSFVELYSQHSFVPPQPLRERIPTIPADVEEVVLKALAKDPTQRFTNVAAFANALKQAYDPTLRQLSPKPSQSSLTYPVPVVRSSAPPLPFTRSEGTEQVPPAITPPQAPAAPDTRTRISTPPTPTFTAHTSGTSFSPPTQKAQTAPTLPVHQPGPFPFPTNLPLEPVSGIPGEPPSRSHGRSITRRAMIIGTVGVVAVGVVGGSAALLASKNVHGSGGQITDVPPAKTTPNTIANTSTSTGTTTSSHNPSPTVQQNNTTPTAGNTATPSPTATGTPTPTPQPQPTATATTPPPPPTLGSTITTYTGHTNDIRALAWSPDGSRICTVSNDYTAQVWNAANGGNALVYRGHANYVEGVAWSPDGSRIATGSADTTVQVWNASNGSPIFTYRGHTYWVNRVSWSPDGQYIASGEQSSQGGQPVQVRVWDANTGNTIVIYTGHTNGVFAVEWSPDGSRIASCGYDNTLQIWEGTTGNHIATYTNNTALFGLSWSPDSTRIAVGSNSTNVLVIDASTGNVYFTCNVQSPQATDAAWSPDGARIAAASTAQSAQTFDANTGTNLYTYPGQPNPVTAVGWSPNSQRVCSGSSNGMARVWQAV